MARYLKKHSWKQLLFCDSLFVDLKNGKCNSRKVRKWHVTIYFYIKRIFICLNSLFPSFCFCNLVNINFTHKINSNMANENMSNENMYKRFGVNICFLTLHLVCDYFHHYYQYCECLYFSIH